MTPEEREKLSVPEQLKLCMARKLLTPVNRGPIKLKADFERPTSKRKRLKSSRAPMRNWWTWWADRYGDDLILYLDKTEKALKQ